MKPKYIAILDIIIFYGSLAITILIRYTDNFDFEFKNHLIPFTLILPFWLLILKLFGTYTKSLIITKNSSTAPQILSAVFVSVITSIVLFYLLSNSIINSFTPKTNLIIFGLVFLLLKSLSEYIFNKTLPHPKIPIITSDKSIFSDQVMQAISVEDSHYRLAFQASSLEDTSKISQKIKDDNIIVLYSENNPLTVGAIPELSRSIKKLKLIEFREFHELLTGTIDPKKLDSGTLGTIYKKRPAYDFFKRAVDLTLSIFGLVFLSPVILVTAILIFIISGKPIIFTQKRTGLNGKEINIYKFRTMRRRSNTESWNAVTTPNDTRITKIGRLLRLLHIDELTQLWNVLRGDISMVGPRPESSELVDHYKSLPSYHLRHAVIPGITGWAQINYKPSTSIEEAYEKLKYDLYYVKNRSFFMDVLILLKTAAKLLHNTHD